MDEHYQAPQNPEELQQLSEEEYTKLFGRPVADWQPLTEDDMGEEDDFYLPVTQEFDDEEKQRIEWAKNLYLKMPHRDLNTKEYGTYKPGVTNETKLVDVAMLAWTTGDESTCNGCGSHISAVERYFYPDDGRNIPDFPIDSYPYDFSDSSAHFLAYHPDTEYAKEAADKIIVAHNYATEVS